MEERKTEQSKPESCISGVDDCKKTEDLQQTWGSFSEGHASRTGLPANAAREPIMNLTLQEKAERMGAQLGTNALEFGKSEVQGDKLSMSEKIPRTEAGSLVRTVEVELESKFRKLPSSLTDTSNASRQGVSASQEQDDILEAWRKKRRQEFAALEGGPLGGSFHKRGLEFGRSDNKRGLEPCGDDNQQGLGSAERNNQRGLESAGSPIKRGPEATGLEAELRDQNIPQSSAALDIPGEGGKGMKATGERWQGNDEEDEELFERLRRRLGVEHTDTAPLSSPLSLSTPLPTPHQRKPPRDHPLVAPSTPTPEVDETSRPQTSETLPVQNTPCGDYSHPSRQSFPLNPTGEFSQTLRFSSNTPPASPRRSLSPAASSGKRSASEPATRRTHPAFSPPLSGSNSESSPSRPSSPSSSESSQQSLRRTNSLDSSPPETPTSFRGPVFEPPARSSGLLTPEDEALLAAMSIVGGRHRSRGSPANRRLPRGNSGLPPQHLPPSLLRRAVSIDPRVEARAVEQREAERSRVVGEKAKFGEKPDFGAKAKIGDRSSENLRSVRGLVEGVKGSPGRSDVGEGFRATELQRGETRGEGSDKRLKRVQGESAGSATATAQAQREKLCEGVRGPDSGEVGRAVIAESLAAADKTPGEFGAGPSEEMRDAVEQGVGPYFEASAEGLSEATEVEAPGRVKGVNRGLVLQILGFDDEDDLEGLGRFLSPVRTKVPDKSRLAKKRSNSFSEFTTAASPPKVPSRMGGGFDREEWSPSRGRKGFGFAGVSRPRKQAPMQPAVANLIAETVEDFWSSDLMGAWGMGQSEPEIDNEEPGSAPGGSAGRSEETKGADGGKIALHRRAISEGSAIMTSRALEDSAPSSPGGGAHLPSDGAVLSGQETETSGGGLGMTGKAGVSKRSGGPNERQNRDGKHDSTSALDLSPRLERVAEEPPAMHPGSLERTPLFPQPAGLPDGVHGSPADDQSGGSSKSAPNVREVGSSKPQGGVDDVLQEASRSNLPSVSGFENEPAGRAGPRVGPPLLDDVFDDGPDVSRLREEIHQREEAIRKLRGARDH